MRRLDEMQRFLTLAAMASIVSLAPMALTGCGTSEVAEESKKDSTPKVAQETGQESDFVTPEDEEKFLKPRTKPSTVEFPEAEFQEGRKLLMQQKPEQGAKVLLSKLDQAAEAAAGQTKLGQYLVRVNNNLFRINKLKEAQKYSILAARIFYAQPPEKRPTPMWFFNVHFRQGLGYKYLGFNKQAELQLRKAVNIASAAPSGQIDWYWHRLVYAELLDTLQREKKTEQAKIVAEQLKEFEKTKPAGK
jgi:hypothetical protein